MSLLSRRVMAAVAAGALLMVASCGSSDDNTGPAPDTSADSGAVTPEADDTVTAEDETADDDSSDSAAPEPEADDAEAEAADTSYPITVTASNGEITIDAQPEAIISLSPTATEMLFAIGAGEQVIAVDDMSDYPADAPQTELSGYTPNIEAIVAYEPDLVVLSDYSASGGDDSVGPALTNLGVPVVEASAAQSLDDVYDQLQLLGDATGHSAAASDVIADMQQAIATAIDSVPQTDRTIKIYHEIDPTPFSVTSATFIGQVYSAFGLENIADNADEDGYGYPQMSVEAVVSADPDAIFLADSVCCQENAETVAARDGWGQVTAVQQGQIYALDDSVASRWGPRIVEFYEAVAKALVDIG